MIITYKDAKETWQDGHRQNISIEIWKEKENIYGSPTCNQVNKNDVRKLSKDD